MLPRTECMIADGAMEDGVLRVSPVRQMIPRRFWSKEAGTDIVGWFLSTSDASSFFVPSEPHG